MVKRSLKFHPSAGGGGGGWFLNDVHIWTHWPKIEKTLKWRSYGLLRVINTLLALYYPKEKDFDKKPNISQILFGQGKTLSGNI